MRKSICSPWLHLRIFTVIVPGLFAALRLQAGEVATTNNLPKFLGAQSCSSSGCHGGGGQHQNQYLVWSLRDFHSQRPTATLTTARSKQIGDALQIKDPTAEQRCTVCHAPLNEVPESRRGEQFKVSEGVSCESCHGPAENWLRPHTRHDYTHADRVAAGMRDLKNLYVRANTCVACHQNVDNDILAAGHPELMFELDGQSVTEPKHWREATNWNGAQAWLVGQAVALREKGWQISKQHIQTETFDALDWLLTNKNLPIPVAPLEGSWPSYLYAQKWGDEAARKMAAASWSDETTRQFLSALAKSDDWFRNNSFSQSLQARRAERLVLALDRLTGALPEFGTNAPVQAALKQLFADAQSRPDFNPTKFADDLSQFARAVGK